MEYGIDRSADQSFVAVNLPGLNVDDRLKMDLEVFFGG
jgi:hypothetical protein